MAVRDRIRVDVLVQRAAVLQEADAELGEVERILRIEQTGDRRRLRHRAAPRTAAARSTAGSAASRCSQQVPSDSIVAP